MNDYKIVVDSACDIAPEILDKWDVTCVPLTFMFGDEGKEYANGEMNVKEFYNRMRAGETARTSAVNVETFKECFRSILEEGTDILYIAFSSGLSTTYNSGRIAAEELSGDYPDRKVIAVDTLSASAGYGLLVNLACEKKKNGESLEGVAKFIEETRLHMCHWFTVDDLVYLKRGGRIHPSVAFVGTLLGIKPVLHMDNEGHLVNMTKVRGRKASVKALADKLGELAIDSTKGPVYLCHGDCREDADELASIIKKEYGIEVGYIADVGPVIGAHSGPGTLAVFFLGKER